MPPHKIALGLATYGRAFALKDASNHGLGAPKHEWQNPPKGTYTREAGFLAYYEICKMGLTVVNDNAVKAPYGYKGTAWIGYDNIQVLGDQQSHLNAFGPKHDVWRVAKFF